MVPARIIEMRPSVLWVVGSEVVSARIVTNVHDFLLPIATYLEIVTAAWLQFSALAPVGLDLAAWRDLETHIVAVVASGRVVYQRGRGT